MPGFYFTSTALSGNLIGFKMDWGRYDDNPDHVYANQKFTRILDDYGISHQAEEYSEIHGLNIGYEKSASKTKQSFF
ncbi:MAG: hypothetical protein B0W54_19570 [Cellvibrio sp. 79]|nr:MAG: hypothetical protein B0W54_19570 [Cellvibrio sp. 79]